ncbi:MAG: Ig-like domain-containing protein [Verrucomicrobiota bacterium]
MLRVLGLLMFANYGVAISEAQTPPVRIMPLGDSLTSGVSSIPVAGAYRNRLHSILTTAGYNVDFVGTNTDANNPALPDKDHQGTGGMRIDEIQAGLLGWVNSVEDPDVVLLLIGTNDFSQNFNLGSVQTRLTNLIADIASKRPFAKIIVSSLPLRTDDSGKQSAQTVFNNAIPGIVNNQISLGRQVSYVNMSGVLVAGDLTDGVHPNQAGYNKMADAWLPAISNVITPLGTANPPAIVRTGPPTDLQHLTVRFSKPLADTAANLANYSLNGGLTISQAVLDAATKRIITLTTTSQTPGTLYTLAVTGVRDRTPQQNQIAPGSTVAFSTDAQTNGSFELDLAGWTATGNLEVKSAAPYTATNGTKLVAFNAGQSTPNGVLTQTFFTTVGVPYVINFDAGVYGTTAQQRLQVNINGSSSLVSQAVTITGQGGSIPRWVPQSFSFVANSTATTLTFTDTSTTSINLDLLLDNVRLTAQVPRTLTVASTPTNGINVTVSPADLNGASGAPTGFSRQYLGGAVVTLSAPSVSGANTFVKWQRNGADLTTNTSTTVTMDADYTLNAVYAPNNQVLVNGSFESGYTGWTQTGNQEIKSTGGYIASDGTKLVGFNTGNLSPNALLSQTFPTTAGVTYTLAFDAGVLSFNTNPQTFLVTATGSGSLLSQVVTVSASTGGTSRWFPKTYTFVANSASTTLAFRDQSTSTSGLDLLLDNVRVTGPVGPINNSPFAVADTYSTTQNVPLVVTATGVLANDTDSESNPLTAILDALPAHGSVTLNANGGFTYTPTTGYSGPDSFTYHANDGNSNSNIVAVSITVNGIATGSLVNGSFESGEAGWTMTGNRVVYDSDGTFVAFDGTKMAIFNAGNSMPDAVTSQTFATSPGQTYQLAFNLGILANNGAEQKMQVTVTGAATLISQPESLFGNSQANTVWSAKSYTFTADSATTTLTFTDISPTTSGADLLLDNVSISIPAANQAPVAVADSYSGTPNTPLVIAAASGVLANDTDANSNPLTAVVDAQPTHGTLTLNTNGSFTYTPETGYTGSDSFTYHANDGSLNSNIVTVSITLGSAQLLVNGSFEAGETGWTMTGNRVVYSSDGSYVAFQGTKMVIFNAGNTLPDAVISQSFATIPGQTYTIDFNMGILALNGTQQRLKIDVTGATVPFSHTETLIGNSSGNSVWSPKSYSFTASGSTATLIFSDISPVNTQIDLMLDNVRVSGAPAGPINTAPVAVADSYSTNQNTALVVPVGTGVLVNDTDAELNPLTALGNVAPAHGSVTLNANGSFTYTPATGYSGPDSFTYHANDGNLDSNIVTVSITVTAAPTSGLVNGSFESGYTGWTTTGNQSIQSAAPYTATEGTKLASFNAGNTSPDAVLSQTFATLAGATYTLAFDAGVFSFNTNQQKLQVTVNGTGSLLTQVININGLGGGSNRWLPQSFTFVADSGSVTLAFRDQSASTSGLDLLLDNVRVTGPPAGNVAPVAAADTYSATPNTPLVVTPAGVLANDVDVNSDPLTAVLGTGPANGTLALNPNGGFTYTPNTGYTGPDSFTYRANDGALDSNLATVSIAVSQPISQLLVNGSFESGFTAWTTTGNIAIESAAPFVPTQGTKLAGFNGGNTTPNGVLSQSFGTLAGQTYTLGFDAGVFSFNTSQQRMQVTVNGSASLLTQVININGLGGGSNRWLPQSFTFTADSAVTTLAFRDQSASTSGLDLMLDNVRVTGPPGVPNTAPVAVAESYNTNQGTALVIAAPGLLANDTDADTNPLTAAVDTLPSHGTLSLAANGGFTYTPATNYSGPDSFTYHANDGVVNSNVVTVSLTVNPVSQGGLANGSFELDEASWTITGNRLVYTTDAFYTAFHGSKLLILNAANNTPNAVVSQTFTTTPGQAYTLAFNVGILAINFDEQKLQVTATGTGPLVTDTISLFGNNAGNTNWTAKSYSFTANSNTTTLTFTDLSTSTGGIDLLLDNVSVTPVAPNAAPVAIANSYSINQDTPLVVAAAGVLANDTDAETDPLTAVLDTPPAHGSVTLNPDGGFTYIPAAHYSGPDSFTYHADDGTSDSNIATVSITVNPYQILVNGSFEAGESGWTMNGNRVVVNNDANFIAFDGTKLLALNAANSTPDAVVSQTFTTIPGEDYVLEFNMGTLGANGIEQKLNVNLNGAAQLLSQTESVFGNNSPTTAWTAKSFAFTADSASTTLTFTDLSTTTSLIDLVLDNVSVTGPSTGAANTAPVAVADSYNASLDIPLVVAAAGVLANDTDAELSPLTAVINASPTHGSVVLNPNGGFTYTPVTGYTGPDSFTYHANDGSLDSNIVTVSITVNPALAGLVNGSFESGFTSWTTTGNVAIESAAPFVPTQGTKLAGFNGGNTTPNGVISQTFGTVAGSTYTLAFDAGVFSFNTNPQKMQVTVNGSASLLTQVININGLGGGSNRWLPQSFTFIADSTTTTLAFRDQSLSTNGLDLMLDNVRVTGPPVGPNTAPVAVADTYATALNTPLVVAAAGVLSNDTDAQANALTAAINVVPTHGTVTLNANGGFTYTPTTGYTGPDSFTYHANDGVLDSNIVTVSITVNASGVNGFVNGSFESNFTGWTTTGNVGIRSDSPYQPIDGTKLAVFNADNTTPNGVLSQTFATTPGATYALAFDAGTLAYNTLQQTLQVNVAGTGSLLSQNVTLLSTNGTTQWSAQSFSFTANSATTTLSFTDTSATSSGLDLVLDNVRVTFNAGVPVLQTLTVISTPVTAAITITPNDSNGSGSGTTNFGRAYPAGTVVNLTAPATSGGVAFQKWRKNGVDLTTNASTSVTMDTSHTLTAIYSDPPFSNGSFETGTFAPWTTSGGTVDSVKINSEIPATNGTKLVEFNSGSSPAGGILRQTFITTPGVTYSLALDLGVRGYNTSQQTMLVAVTGTGSLLSQTVSINAINNGTIKWETKTFSFIANSGTTTLSLTDTSVITNAIDMLLDNVRVNNANARTLTVDSVVASSVSITMTPTDNNGNSNGTTQLTRSYNVGTSVTLTAPGTSGGATFLKWVKDGADFAVTPVTSVTMSADTTMFAVYSGGTYPPLGPNLLQNGSFESLSPEYAFWAHGGATRIEQPGPGYPEYTTDGWNTLSFNVGGEPNDGHVEQSFATTIGTTYTVQLDAAAFGPSALNQTLIVAVYGNGTLLSRSIPLTGTSGTFSWAPLTFSFTANSTTSTLQLADGSSTGSGVDLYMDNVRVKQGMLAPAILTVNSTPASGKALTISPTDMAGQGNGSTNLTRIYNAGAMVTLVAPHTGFVKWLKNGQWYATNNTITVAMDTSHTMTVVYTDPPVLGPFINGSFEQEFAGWTWAGSAQAVKVKDGLPTTDGLLVIEFNSANSANDGSISQTFTTTPGASYTVNFDMGSKAFNTAIQNLRCQVTGTGSLVSQLFSIGGAGNGNVTYFPKTLTFTANSAASTITFSDQSTTGVGIDLLLDNVRIINANSRTLTVGSAVANSVPITISPVDNNGSSNGTTQFTRNYDMGTNVTLTAPGTASGGATFVKWVKDGVDFAVTPATSVTMSTNTSMFAVYTGGTYLPLGPNLLQNGSFESLSPQYAFWAHDGATRIEQPGPGYPEYTTDGWNTLSFNVGDEPNNGHVEQSFATTIGTTYTVQLDAAAFGPSALNQTLNVAVYGNGTLVTRSFPLTGTSSTFAWAPLTFSFTANSTTSTLQLADGSTTGSGVDLYMDNVRVREGSLAPAILTVNSTPATGKAVTVTPADLAGQTNGTTNFTRIYTAGAMVTLVAPHTGFVKWLKDGQWYATNNTITVSMDTSHTMTVVYTATPVLGPFINGSFEQEFAGWTWTGSAQAVKVKDGLPTTHGLMVIEFNSANSANDGSISQTFTTVQGATYTVNFDVGTKAFNTASQTLRCRAVGSGTLVSQNFSVNGAGNGDVTYVNRSVTFVANSATTTLSFSDLSSTGAGIDLLLDNVIVTGPAAAPIPESAAPESAGTPNPLGEIGSASMTSTPGGSFTISTSGVEVGRTYILQRSEDLSTWETIAEKEATEPGQLDFQDNPNLIAPEAPKARMFYRIGKQPVD